MELCRGAAPGVNPGIGVSPAAVCTGLIAGKPLEGTTAGVFAAFMVDAEAAIAVVAGTDAAAGAVAIAAGVGASVTLEGWGAGVSPGVLPAAIEAGEPKAQAPSCAAGAAVPPGVVL